MEEEEKCPEIIDNPEIEVEEAASNNIDEELNVGQTEITTPCTHMP